MDQRHYPSHRGLARSSLPLRPPVPRVHKRSLVLERQTDALVPPQAGQRLGDLVEDALLLHRDISAASRDVALVVPCVGAVGLGAGRIAHGLGDADADADGGTRQEVPEKGEPAAGHGGRDVAGRVAQADGEDVRVGGGGEQRGGQGQHGLAVGGRGLGEDGDDAGRVGGEEGVEVVEGGAGGRRQADGAEGGGDGGEQGDALELAGRGVGAREDGVEDGGEVEGVDGRGQGRGDDGGRVGEAAGRLVGEGAAAHAVELQVDPPQAGDGHQGPEQGFADDHGQGQVVEEEKVGGRQGQEERQAQEEQRRVEGVGQRRHGRLDGHEGRDA
ncbi:hypothetical protein BN1723_006606 [Verticillium longisporum]|uniref:Uncharacterized protein n=1 Tax=Verticillium longisporum TaxID=100787 RepID=A0A0G4NGH3_VERLO|nr:hypothetical protein BN1723_006606 [Verticillium longisporum]